MSHKNALDSLFVRPVFKEEVSLWDSYMNEFHYLGLKWLGAFVAFCSLTPFSLFRVTLKVFFTTQNRFQNLKRDLIYRSRCCRMFF
jgi:hypothetical protein